MKCQGRGVSEHPTSSEKGRDGGRTVGGDDREETVRGMQSEYV